MVHITHIPANQLNETDLALLDSFNKQWSNDGTTLQETLELIAERKLSIFRVSGDAQGLFGIELVPKAHATEMWVTLMIGKNFHPHAQEIWWKLSQISDWFKATSIHFAIKHRAISRVLQSVLKLKPEATVYRQETGHGLF